MTLAKSGSGSIGEVKFRHLPEFTKWNAIHSAEHDAEANSWFADQSLVTLTKYLTDRGETAKTMSNIRHWLTRYFEPSETSIPAKLMIDVELLGEAIPISESVLGQSIIDALSEGKRTWRFAPRLEEYLSHFDLESSDTDFDPTEIFVWDTFDDEVTCFVSIRVFKNKRGQETPMVYSPILIGSRPMHHITKWWVRNSRSNDLEYDEVPREDLGKVLNIGEWPEQIAQVVLAKRLFLEAERGTTDSNTREELFSHLASSDLPTPVLFGKTNSRVPGTFRADSGDLIATAEVFPHVVYSGWKLDNGDSATVAQTLEILIPAARRMQLVLSDGFESNSLGYSDLNWDVSTLAPTIMLADNPPGSFNGAGFWVPGIWASIRSAQTRWHNDQAHDQALNNEQQRSAAEGASYRGVGFSAASAINTFSFGYLFDEGDFPLAERLLELSWRMECPDESTNSISNWGIARFIQNDFDGAREKFKLALAREDHFADGEAYAYLAEIASIEGDQSLSNDYRCKCDESGGYSSAIRTRNEVQVQALPIDISNESPTLTKSSSESLGSPTLTKGSSGSSAVAKFCTQCGTEFRNDSDRFCTQCGGRRLS